MVTNKEKFEFNILGQKLTFRPGEDNCDISAEKSIDRVAQEVSKVRNNFNGLNETQIGVLVALNLANELQQTEESYRETTEKLQTTALDALQYIEEVSPTTV